MAKRCVNDNGLRYLLTRFKALFAPTSHSHDYNDLMNKPAIPTKLPADGGNADTVDGYHVVISSDPPTNATNNTITFVV